MDHTPNPFTNRGMVTDPTDFIGRAEQMEEICTRLGKMESTSVVGERRIGKSSLLYHLAQTPRAADQGLTVVLLLFESL